VLLGLLFQWAARRFVRSGRTLAQAYGVESAGALVGGLVATILLRAGAQTFTLALLCALVSLGAPLAGPIRAGRRPARAAAALLLLGFATLFWRGSVLDRQLATWQHPNLVEARDSPYARVTLTRRGDQTAVFENNALVFDTESADPEAFAHLVALQHPSPARMLLLGGGFEGLGRYLRQHGLSQLDRVELDAVTVALVSRYISATSGAGEANPPLIFDDPRRFLSGAGRYDAIVVGMPDPDSGAANRFYTREFFAICAAHLTPGGVLGLRLRTAENLWTPAQTARTASIYRALRLAFADVIVLPGATNVVVASQSPLTRDPAILVDRLTARGIRARVVTPQYLRYLYPNDRRVEIARLLESTPAEPNTDVRPACYQHAAIIWLGKLWPAVSRLDVAALAARTTGGRLGRWLLAGLVLVVFLGARRRSERRRRLLVFVAGLAGMVLEIVLLLHYQMKHGVLFEDLGALLAAFMGGLAAGAVIARQLGVVREGVGGRRHVARWWSAAILALLTLVACGVAGLVTAGIAAGVASLALLLAVVGFLVAALFASASLHDVADQQAVISPLYAADLMGGCVGSLVATLVLIPLAGLAATALWVAAFAGVSLLLI
jgi:spermidine synthase